MEAGVRFVGATSVWGVFPGWELYLTPTHQQSDGAAPDIVRASAVVVATGAAQRPLAVPGWTLPGVLTAGAAQSLITVHRVRPGKRAVVVGVDGLGLMAARHLSLAGVDVLAVLPPAPSLLVGDAADPRHNMANLLGLSGYAPIPLRIAGGIIQFARLAQAATWLYPRGGVRAWGIPILVHRVVTAVRGSDSVTAVQTARLGRDGELRDGSEEWSVDTVVTSGGLFPLTDLVQSAGCPVIHVPGLGGHVPVHGPDLQTPVEGLFVAGSVTGVAGWPLAAAQGHLVGISVMKYLRGTSAQLARDLAQARAGVVAARRTSLFATAQAKRSLVALAQAWARHVHEASTDT
jgi:sarcosine oxidase subunit alpha